MRQKSMGSKAGAEATVRDIRRQTVCFQKPQVIQRGDADLKRRVVEEDKQRPVACRCSLFG